MPPAPTLTAPKTPQVPPKHGMVHNSLEVARRQVEQGVVALLVVQVLPVFEGLFRGEAQVAPKGFPPKRYLGDILHVNDHRNDNCGTSLYCLYLICIRLTCLFLSGCFPTRPFLLASAGEFGQTPKPRGHHCFFKSLLARF